MRRSSLIVASSSFFSSASSSRPSCVSRPSAMSRMWLAWISENPNRLPISAVARRGAVLRRADRLDDRVDHVERLEQALDDVQARLGLLEPELRAAGDDDDLVVEPRLQRVLQVDRARHAVDERHHVHRERRLRGRVLEQVVQHDLRVRVGAQLDHEPGLALPRLVADVADAVDLARSRPARRACPRSRRRSSGTAPR